MVWGFGWSLRGLGRALERVPFGHLACLTAQRENDPACTSVRRPFRMSQSNSTSYRLMREPFSTAHAALLRLRRKVVLETAFSDVSQPAHNLHDVENTFSAFSVKNTL